MIKVVVFNQDKSIKVWNRALLPLQSILRFFFLKVMAECCYKKKCLPLTMMKSKHFMNKTFWFLF